MQSKGSTSGQFKAKAAWMLRAEVFPSQLDVRQTNRTEIVELQDVSRQKSQGGIRRFHLKRLCEGLRAIGPSRVNKRIGAEGVPKWVVAEHLAGLFSKVLLHPHAVDLDFSNVFSPQFKQVPKRLVIELGNRFSKQFVQGHSIGHFDSSDHGAGPVFSETPQHERGIDFAAREDFSQRLEKAFVVLAFPGILHLRQRAPGCFLYQLWEQWRVIPPENAR